MSIPEVWYKSSIKLDKSSSTQIYRTGNRNQSLLLLKQEGLKNYRVLLPARLDEYLNRDLPEYVDVGLVKRGEGLLFQHDKLGTFLNPQFSFN